MKKLISLLIFCLFLCSCYDKDEPNDIAYVTAIGIDKSENNEKEYIFTIQFANPINISGGSSEEGGSGDNQVENITIKAPNIYSSIGIANHVISKKLILSHMKLFVFSKEIAEEGVSQFLETISRSEEIRPNVYTAVCREKANDYLINNKPLVEINPIKYYQLTFEKDNYRGIPESLNQSLYFFTNLAEKNAIIPLTAIANEEKQEIPINTDEFEYMIYDYKAGETGKYEEKKGEAIGSAVFKGDKMIGELGFIETKLYNIITNKNAKNYLTVKSTKSETPITITISEVDKTKIKYNKEENRAEVNLSLEGDFVSLPDDYLTEYDIKSFEEEIKNTIKKKTEELISITQNEFNSDIIGFGTYAKYKFLTNEAFASFDWENKYKTMSYTIKVDFNIRRTGLTVRTR